MSKTYSYEVNVKWDEDRKGTMSSPVLDQHIEVATPPEFPKGMAGIWSPEHLFVASVNSCLMTTFLAIAENSKLDFESFSCGAKGTMEKVDGTFQISKITLHPQVIVTEEKSIDRANRILQMSEKACLISNSIKTEVTMEPTVEVTEMA